MFYREEEVEAEAEAEEEEEMTLNCLLEKKTRIECV